MHARDVNVRRVCRRIFHKMCCASSDVTQSIKCADDVIAEAVRSFLTREERRPRQQLSLPKAEIEQSF